MSLANSDKRGKDKTRNRNVETGIKRGIEDKTRNWG